jgi:biotin synthase
MRINDFINKSQDSGKFTKDELLEMPGYPPDGDATYRIMSEAKRIFRELTGDKAEIHAQFSLNLEPCACNCLFCSFAKTNEIFKQKSRMTQEEAVASARQLEEEGANAIFIMTTSAST